VGLKAGDGGADVRTAALVDPDPPGGAVEDPLHAVASIAEIRNGATRRAPPSAIGLTKGGCGDHPGTGCRPRSMHFTQPLRDIPFGSSSVSYARCMRTPIGIPSENAPGGAVLALVAHDEKKDDLLRLASRYRTALERLHLIATGHTGRQLAELLDLPVECVASGPEGGDIQIGARIVTGDVDAVVFLRDPLTAHPHEPDIQALLKVCDVHGVPVATNLASADILLRSLSQAIWWGRDAAGAV
jgi:methylglyoxal synthase